MSGIAGIVSLEAACPTAAQIEAMTATLERRGPDGTHFLIDGHAALGHTLLATTPEALVETLPLTHGLSGCTITADARLDNRPDLINSLGLAGAPREIGDGELILSAYLKWGEECPRHLLGDFAFAIWDPRSATLLCARDQIGVRQLTYYHEAGRRFIFATEPCAILALRDVHAPLNHERIGDYLGNMEGADFSSTFFEGIYRLAPAHTLRVDRSGIVLRRYWELAPEPVLVLPSDEAYAEAFLAVLTEAVRCRLRSARSIGAMVSGGIDSNSVAAVAAELLAEQKRGPLPTFSAVGPNTFNCPETRAIRTALRSPTFAPTIINYAALGSIGADLARQTATSVEPFDADQAMIRAIYLAAQRAGINIVLDGRGGDVVLSSNFHLAFLLRDGILRQVIREASGQRRFWGSAVPAWRSVLAAAWQAFCPLRIRAVRFRLGRRKSDREFLKSAKLLAPYLDTTSALNRRRQVQRRDFECDRLDKLTQLRYLTHPNLVVANERYDRLASGCGIEPRDPFLDLRLIQFCLSLPRDQLQRSGWPKWILRCAMERHVSADIVWRNGKEHLGTEFRRLVVDERTYPIPRDRGNAENRKLTVHCQGIFLLNWFACMAR